MVLFKRVEVCLLGRIRSSVLECREIIVQDLPVCERQVAEFQSRMIKGKVSCFFLRVNHMAAALEGLVAEKKDEVVSLKLGKFVDRADLCTA